MAVEAQIPQTSRGRIKRLKSIKKRVLLAEKQGYYDKDT